MSLYTFPTAEKLTQSADVVPEFMRPNTIPYAAVLEGFLSDDECDAIQEKLSLIEPYAFSGCGGITRECVTDLTLDLIETAARNLNKWYWQYDLDPGQHSWLQTYETGNSYKRHMDGAPGQMRKLTAVALLSRPEDYNGGWLNLYVPPKSCPVPKTRGTIVVFQPWIEHEVTIVSDGTRQTINMGFWGPPFK